MDRVLAIGAHPDDVDFGAAGVMQRAKVCWIIVASNGARGGDGAQRMIEAHTAAKQIESGCIVLSHADTAIRAADLAPELEEQLRHFKPSLVVTHSPHDAHQDHAAVSAATLIATRDWCGTILGYLTPSAAEHFTPNWFIGLTEDEMRTKIAMAACHQSQAARPYLAPAYLEAAGRYWAQVTRSSAPFVEPYELLRYRER